MNQIKRYIPILQWLPSYKTSYLQGDLTAGLTIAIMLIPQGMAYALIAGLPPVYGLYASIIPQITYALLGTSRQLSVAPVATDSILVAAGVSVLALEGTEAYLTLAILLAFLVGAFQFILGVLKMGFITNLLSRPVISGFTSAAAIIIAISQLKYLLGTNTGRSNQVFQILWDTLLQLNEIHLTTFLLGFFGVIIIVVLKKTDHRIPGMLIVVALGTFLVYFFRLDQSGVAIVADIPRGLPAFRIPDFSKEQISSLIPLAATIAVVAYMEAFSVAKAIESKKRDHLVLANQELRALGASNMAGAFFRSFPVTGGFSRSAVNLESGAHTQLSSIVSAGLIAVTLLFLTPLFYYLPNAILASVILVAVSSLIDLKYAVRLFKEERLEFFLLLATFMVTLIFNMVPGIITGVVLSILLILYHAAYPHIARLGRLRGQTEFRNILRFKDLETWEEKLILRIDAPITFINIQYVKDFIEHELSKNRKIKRVILDASAISYVDATAIQGISDLVGNLKEKGIDFLLSEVVGPVRDALFTTKLLDEIGTKNIFLTLHDAVESEHIENYEKREKAIQHND